MRLLLIVLCIALQCALCTQGQAATREAPAYRKAALETLYPWQEGLRLSIDVDEQACRKKYGTHWQNNCFASFGEYGRPVQGVSMNPPAKGRWIWQEGTTMQFIPEGAALLPNTTYTVDIRAMPRAASVLVANEVLTCTTMPQAVMLSEKRFWVDPSPRAAHVLTATLQFAYPVGDVPSVIRCTVPKGVQSGNPDLVWNAARDSLNLALPIKSLPKEAVQAQIFVQGLPQFTENDGLITLYPLKKNTQGASFSANITGSNSLFTLNTVNLSLENDAQLNRTSVLSLEPSLYTAPEELLKHITVVQLPTYNTAAATRPYNWQAAPFVSAEVLNKGKVVKSVSLQKDNSPVSRLRFGVNVTPGSYVLVDVDAQCAAASGLTLGKPWRQILQAGSDVATVNFLQPGNVLALSGKKVLDVYGTDISAIRWEAEQVREPFLALMAQESDNAFTSPLQFSSLDIASLSVRASGELPLPKAAAGKAGFAALDLAPLMGQAGTDTRGLMRVTLKGMKDGKEVASASRMVLLTDLGMMVKKNALGGYDFFVHSLGTGKPVAQAAVSVLGANGKPVASSSTDALGHAVLPPLTGLERERRPVAAVAQLSANKQVDLAWLPLDDSSRVLDYSNYAVSGQQSANAGINAAVFAQRGMFRPGEMLHFGCLVRSADWAVLPPAMPLEAVLYNPADRIVLKKSFTANEAGISLFDWQSSENAPSGRYHFDVRLPGSGMVLGSAVVRMEEFQPDTMSMQARLDAKPAQGWVQLHEGKTLSLAVTLNNLYGLPATKRRVTAQLRLNPAHFAFAGFEDYIFHDTKPFTGQGIDQPLPEKITDERGMALLPLPASLVGGSSAECSVLTEGFEADGGRATTAQTTFIVSPQAYMLGYKPVGAVTNVQFIPQGSQAKLNFIAVNPHLEQIAVPKLHFTVAARRYVSSLVSDASGLYRYDDMPVDTPISTAEYNLTAAGLQWAVPTKQAGEYLLTVKNEQGQALASVPFSIAGEQLAGADSDLAASKMRLRLNKTAYDAGETIKLALSVPYDGVGLITLERENVAAFAWFSAKAGDTVQEIAIPAGFEGRGYVNVSFVRAAHSPSIYMKPHSFAIAPFTAAVRQRDMQLGLTAPQSLRPGESLPVTLRAKEQGKAVIFAVDEGVLQLTNFATPSPLRHLLLDRALDVSTLQAFDLLMPDHALLAGRIPAFGGDMNMLGGRFYNPFKRRNEPPLATWSQLVDVSPQGVTVNIPVPAYYNGKLRIMAVASSAGSVGSVAQASTVVAPVIITPQLPLSLSPKDSFDGAIVLANSTQSPVSLTLSLKADAGLKLQKPLPASVSVPAQAETIVPLSMKAGSEPSNATVHISAHDGKTSYTREASLSIRPASGLRTSVMAGTVQGSATIDVPRSVYALGASSSASLSAAPLPLVRAFATYTAQYPYACTEQSISRAFPLALLQQYPDMLPKAEEREALLAGALAGIQAGLGYSGVSLWPEGTAEPLLTVYAADFLLTLREAGLGLNEGMVQQLCDAVERGCTLREPSLAEARRCAYGIWVLTREGRVTTQLIESLLDGLKEVQSWQQDVTAVLIAASQSMMHMTKVQPFEQVRYTAEDAWFSPFALQALHTTLLARHFPERLTQSLRTDMIENSVMTVQNNGYATFSAAQAVRALLSMNTAASTALPAVRLACTEGEGQSSTHSLAEGAVLSLAIPQCRKYSIEAPQGQPLYWHIVTTGFDRTPPSKAAAQGIEVQRSYVNAAGEPISRVKQGDEITVRVLARAQSAEQKDCVITDLLPGGFEMVLARNANGQEEKPQGLTRIDRREDRMLLFADLTAREMVYTYRIRAVSRGQFTVPAVQGEAMYNQNVYAHGVAGSITVE
ncbi:MAG: MG2 domain-containing protein [Desulfovibrionaceae bacterium]|nr:MG2 domain-containing protein [Desulfovibrionaceae bacterium]